MEVPAACAQFPEQVAEIDQTVSDEVADGFMALPDAIHTQQICPDELGMLFFNQCRPHDHVHVSAFVFQTDKYHAFRRSRTLPGSDQATGPGQASIGPLRKQMGGRNKMIALEPGT